MDAHITFFKKSVFVLSKNPILFLLPSVGAILSITIEIIFATELYYSNGNKVFLPDRILVGLFFAAFTIIYFQLGISKSIISLGAAPKNNNHSTGVLELFIIYSIYSLLLVFIGGYEGQVRETYSIKSDPFSLYASKITTYHNIIAIVPSGIVIVLSYTLASFLFSAWMVQYAVVKDQDIMRDGLVESFRKLAYNSTFKDTRKKMLSLFLVTLVTSIIDFVLSNIEVTHISDTLDSYLYQFVILSVVDSLYAPFFLICLFLIIPSGSISSSAN
jgi:hypothetical protein